MGVKPWAGCSEAHARILDTLRRLAPTELEILITGPSGVGKELYARYAHDASPRAGRPFVGVNCGAIPADLVENELFGHVGGAFTGARARADGLVAEAEGGTLFLDEVDAISPRNQVTLLRFVQEKEYRRLGEPRVRRADVRIISASNCDLAAAARDGRFREDLLFRLRVAPIDIPPLRDRPEDIEEIWERYAVYYAAEYAAPRIDLSLAAGAAVRRHGWPGNVRELENCIRYLTCLRLGRLVEPSDLPFLPPPPAPAIPGPADFLAAWRPGLRSPAGANGPSPPSNGAPGANGHSHSRDGHATGAVPSPSSAVPVSNGHSTGSHAPPSNGHAAAPGGHSSGAASPDGYTVYPADYRTAKAAVVGEFERSMVQRALDDSRGNITQAARALGKPRRTFFALMRKHNICPQRIG